MLVQSSPDEAAAEAAFGRAVAIARDQGAKWWELRAAVSLARLLGRRSSQRREDGRHILAESYSRFSEGFDTSDLREAKALLEELS